MTTIEQQTAYRIIGNRFFENISLGYMTGRNVREKILPTNALPSLDEKLEQAANYTPADLEREEEYHARHYYAKTLDVLAGEVTGKVLSPVAFVVGLLYTPRR